MNTTVVSLLKRLALAALLLSIWAGPAHGMSTRDGEPVPLGKGTVNVYLSIGDDGFPAAIGIRLSEAALDGLPAEPNNTTRCFDRNSDGKLEAGVECLGEYETFLFLPDDPASATLPFKFLELDWNAHGHAPPGVYDKPHFDMHFYMVNQAAVAAIRPGPCGIMVDCEDFARASMPLAEPFLPAGYVDVGAVVAEMGNHLVNTASPELATPPQPFTHTLIYGAYDGRITFIEPMMTRDFLLTRPDGCWPIVQPSRWQSAGRYPTEYCVRHSQSEAAWTISLEGFKDHTASASTTPGFTDTASATTPDNR